MTATFYLSAVIVGSIAALVLVLLHRANDAMTRRNLAGIGHNTPETIVGHPGAFSDALARPGGAVTLTGHSGVSSRPFADDVTLRWANPLTVAKGPVIDGQWREYASSVPRVQKGSTTIRPYKRNRLGPGPATVGAVEIVSSVPHHAPAASSDVVVPMLQSVITAVVVTLCIGILALTAGRTDALRIVGVSFVVTLCGAWLWRLGIVTSLLTTIERVTQDVDDADDEHAEDPAHVMLENPNQARQTAGRIAGEHAGAIKTAELLSFLTRCAVVGTSEGKLGIGTGPQARAHYAALRDTLIALGIGQWRDENRRAAGWLLTMTPAQAAPIISRHVRELRPE